MTLNLSVALLHIFPYGESEECDLPQREVSMLFTEVDSNFSVVAEGEITCVESGADKAVAFSDTMGRKWSVIAHTVTEFTRTLHNMPYLLHTPCLTDECLEKIKAL